MSRIKQVAVLIETSNSYARGLLQGIMSYVRTHGQWVLHLEEHGRGEISRNELADWKGDGLIARIENRRIARVVRDRDLPTIDVSAARLLPHLPWVETDDEAMAQAAADHLLQCGLTHFAYCGDDRFNWSIWRCHHFQQAIERAGFTCHLAPSSSPNPAALTRWVRKLPKPVGIMACYDILGREVLEACRRANVAVPDEVALVGVDNDELLCEFANPPLSSVVPDSWRTGWVAAELLNKMMSGQSEIPSSCLIPPVGIVTRRSTDTLAIEDPDLSAAIRFIRDHACEGMTVESLLKEIPLSRRVLEDRFQRTLGCTPHAEILRVRLERAKAYLVREIWDLDTIARRTGFRSGEYLNVAFKRELGLTPGQYRAQHRH